MVIQQQISQVTISIVRISALNGIVRALTTCHFHELEDLLEMLVLGAPNSWEGKINLPNNCKHRSQDFNVEYQRGCSSLSPSSWGNFETARLRSRKQLNATIRNTSWFLPSMSESLNFIRVKTGNSCREALDFQDKSEREKMKSHGNERERETTRQQTSGLRCILWHGLRWAQLHKIWF